MRVLVVDPDPASRAALSALVRGASDCEVVPVASAAAARAAFDPSVCLVVAQLGLPDGSGLTLWRALRDRRRARDAIACVLVAADIDEETAAGAIAAGADVVEAPVRAAELSARVRRALVDRSARAASAARERRLTDRYRRLERRRAELQQLVHVDALTGVVNRRHLEELLDVEIRRAQRERAGLAVVIVDVDHFHEFNETCGHIEGDRCLARIARALASELRRPSDVVARYGGDEFVVLLPRTDAAGAGLVAERLRRAIERAAIPHQTSLGTVVTASLGVGVMAAGDPLSAGALFALADAALLDAKRLGRNRWAGAAPTQVAATPAAGTWPEPVRVDPTLYDRIPDVLARKQREIAALDASPPLLALGLAADLKRLGRELGFAEVVRLGGRLERALRAGDRAAVSHLGAELRAYLARVPVIYLRA
ncbi:MAG TPA: diguanylate cyclase [Kofleriaceae bacterium]|nr:diguanylate cyclase [Kofleriaceae bacterium]